MSSQTDFGHTHHGHHLLHKHNIGSHGYKRISIALFSAGLATFMAMYSAQSLLRVFSIFFKVSPTISALSVSLTTGLLALSIIPASILSEKYGRVRVMSWCAIISSIIGIIIPFSTDMDILLVGRALQGITLAGVPAVAMAYLAEEVHEDSLAKAMGRYVAGTTIGGLLGRLVTSSMLEEFSWQYAMATSAVLTLIFALLFRMNAPQSNFFQPKRISFRTEMKHLVTHLKNPALSSMYLIGFLMMGGFVSLYNFLGYRLSGAPFHLSDPVIGCIFILYIAGTYTSVKAGKLADKYGRETIVVVSIIITAIGLLLTVVNNLWIILIGVLLFTGGFFAVHSTVSGWVSRIATTNRAEAAALYLFAYYIGSAILGACSGIFYQSFAWIGIVYFLLALIVISLVISVVLNTVFIKKADKNIAMNQVKS